MWRIPVTDRNLGDVKQKNAKAYLNAQDLNRIESNIAWVWECSGLRDFGVRLRPLKTWFVGDIITRGDIERVIYNIKTLENALAHTGLSIDIEGRDFKMVNAMELALERLYLYAGEVGSVRPRLLGGKRLGDYGLI